MTFDSFVAPLIGAAGIILGSMATIIFSRILAPRSAHRANQPTRRSIVPVFWEASNSLEFRILRALLGESEGRYLDAFQKKYYRPSLEATIAKGWVEQIGSRYFMTPKGLEVCETYLMQLLNRRQPGDHISA